jgi:hypothetical protein
MASQQTAWFNRRGHLAPSGRYAFNEGNFDTALFSTFSSWCV